MRLFVALDLPDAVRQPLAAWRADLPGARWTPAGRMHLTLRFLGDTSDELMVAITDQIATVEAAPVPVRAEGLVRLPSARRVRVVAAAVEPAQALRALHARVEAALAQAGVEPDGRPLLPHVTLARLKRPDAAAVRRALRDAEPPQAEGVAASVSLVQSERQPEGGPRYTPLLTVRLAG